jgi:hypothetical protein
MPGQLCSYNPKVAESLVPRKKIELTDQYLEKAGRGIGSRKSARLYLFQRVRQLTCSDR